MFINVKVPTIVSELSTLARLISHISKPDAKPGAVSSLINLSFTINSFDSTVVVLPSTRKSPYIITVPLLPSLALPPVCGYGSKANISGPYIIFAPE